MGQAAVYRRTLLAAVASTFAGEPFMRQGCTGARAMPVNLPQATVLSSHPDRTPSRLWRRSLADASSSVNCGWEHHRGFFMSDYAKHPGQVHHAVFGSLAEAQSDCVRSGRHCLLSHSRPHSHLARPCGAGRNRRGLQRRDLHGIRGVHCPKPRPFASLVRYGGDAGQDWLPWRVRFWIDWKRWLRRAALVRDIFPRGCGKHGIASTRREPRHSNCCWGLRRSQCQAASSCS